MDEVAGHRKVRAFVALGSNLGDSQAQMRRAFEELDALPGTRLIAHSSLYRTAPVGYLDQPDFVNAVAELETGLQPMELLNALLAIEQRHGRRREFANAPRTLDLDILLYDDLQHHEHGLTVPHPRMHERAFVLEPLVEIAPGCLIPGRGPARDWLAAAGDQGVRRIA